MIVRVTLALNIFTPLSYEFSGPAANVPVGTRVIVPVGRRLVSGWIIGHDSDFHGAMKPVVGIVHDGWWPEKRFLEFSRQCAETYVISQGLLLHHALAPKRKALNQLQLELAGRKRRWPELDPLTLLQAARGAFLDFYYPATATTTELESPAVTDTLFGETLYVSQQPEGYYRQAIDACLQSGRSVLFLVPDRTTADYWCDLWPDGQAYHSGVSAGKRDRAWEKLCQQNASQLVIGEQAAALLPLTNLGLVIHDRCGQPARLPDPESALAIGHLARLRAEIWNIPLLAGNPALTLRAMAQPQRLRIVAERPARQVATTVVPIKKGEYGIPPELLQQIGERFRLGEKIAVIVNRKKSFFYPFCPQCQKIINCPRCGAPWRREKEGQVACSGCAFLSNQEATCPVCRQPVAWIRELGLDSLASAIRTSVCETGVVSLAAETGKKMPALLQTVEQNRIILATPFLLQPLLRARFSTVILFRPEAIFSMKDYDSAEALFASVVEASELAANEGQVFVYSAYHFHYALRLANDQKAFLDRELKYRRWFALPPFSSVYHLEVKNDSLRTLAAAMRDIRINYCDAWHIRRSYLKSREKTRGYYRGVLELHTEAEAVLRSGLVDFGRTRLWPVMIC